jgi:hypothetical protein
MTEGRANEQAGGHVDRGRVAVLILGLIAVSGAVVLWLLPTSPPMTKAAENTTTTVTDNAGHMSTTTVTGNTTSRSDAMLVGILTFGVGLLVVAVFWNRIQEFKIGGISIRLAEAAADTPEIALVGTVADKVDDASVEDLMDKVDTISVRGLRFVLVNLESGNKWPYTNLSVFMLLLARRSNVEEVIFIGQEPTGPETYLGAASVTWLADKIAAEDHNLFATYHTLETTTSEPRTSIAARFLAELGQIPENDWVDATRLNKLAKSALIHDRVESRGEQTLSKKQQRAILLFPLNFVPITVNDQFDVVVDKKWLTAEIALRTVGF